MNNSNEPLDLFSSLEDIEGPEPPELFIPPDIKNDWAVKDSITSMEYPIFSLSKNPDTSIRQYTRGDKTLRIIPSGLGAATVFDQDLLIYCISQIAEAANQGKKVSRRIKIEIHPFLKGTQRSTGGASYERVVDMCRRLKGTTIETNIKTNETERLHGFGLIEDYKVTKPTKNEKGALELEVTISEWFYRAAIEFNILTLNPDYFKLHQALERRLYEIGRKHCGDQAWWSCSIPLLLEKTGSTLSEKYFRREIKNIIANNKLPEYTLALDISTRPHQLVFLTKDNAKLFLGAHRKNKLEWLNKILGFEEKGKSKLLL